MLRLAACLAVLAPGGAAAGDLVIEVKGILTIAGAIHYAVYDRPENYPTFHGRIAKGAVAVHGDTVRIVVPKLRPGGYAVAVFHDEDGNGEFTQGLFGIPLEQYGFSNDARGFFAAPGFEAARFEIGEGTRRITITLGF